MKKTNELSIKKKIEIAKRLRTNASHRALADEYKTSKSTISRINAKRDQYLDIKESIISKNFKRLPYNVKTDSLIQLIREDFDKLRKKGVSITTETIKTIGLKHATNCGLNNFKFSYSFFIKLKKILNIKYKTLSGSAESYDKNAAENFVLNFDNIVSDYKEEDIFNCDESCFYLRGQRKKSFVIDECTQLKKDSEKITCLLSCSTTGEKLPLLFIGKSKKPRCFKSHNLKSYDFKYYANNSAFMTSCIFNDYLTKINSQMQSKNRKIILFLDNCTSHTEKDYSNIKLVFLPPNTSALIQPLDMGIIKAIKDKYKNRISQYIVSSINNDSITLKSIKIIDCMIWLKEIWKSLPCSTIINCWRKSGLIKTKKNNENDESKLDFQEVIVEDEYEEEESDIKNRTATDEILFIDFEDELKKVDKNDCTELKRLIHGIKEILEGVDGNIYNEVLKFEELLETNIIIPHLKGDIRRWFK